MRLKENTYNLEEISTIISVGTLPENIFAELHVKGYLEAFNDNIKCTVQFNEYYYFC